MTRAELLKAAFEAAGYDYDIFENFTPAEIKSNLEKMSNEELAEYIA